MESRVSGPWDIEQVLQVQKYTDAVFTACFHNTAKYPDQTIKILPCGSSHYTAEHPERVKSYRNTNKEASEDIFTGV